MRLAKQIAVLALLLAGCAAPTVDQGGTLRRGTENGAEQEDPEDRAGPAPSADAGAPGTGGSTTDGSSPPPSPGPGVGDLKPGKTTRTLSVAGQSRSVVLVVPNAIETQAVPLVIALHGNGDSATNFVATRGLEQLAESQGFVVAAPQGIVQNIQVGGQQVNGVSWDAYRDLAAGNIDLALLDAIRSQLVTTGGQIDAKRVVVFGYSQGGYLAFRYGIDASSTLACTSVVAAASPLGSGYVSKATRKIPFALAIGANDGALSQARAAKTALESASHPLQYREIAGAGHAPFPGTTADALAFCLDQSLP